MTLNRSLILAASVLALGMGAAQAGDGQNNSRIQNSIYDTARGDVSQPSGDVMQEGRSATFAPLPADSRAQLREDDNNDPFYFRQTTRSTD